MDEGVGSHQSELQKMKLKSKQTYTYGHFLLLNLSMGWFPLQQYIVTRKGSFPPLLPGEQLVGGKTFSLSSVMMLTFWKVLLSTVVLWLLLFTSPDAGKCRAPSLCRSVGFCRVFFGLPHLRHWLLWVTWPFTSILVTSFMIKKGQAMQGSDTVHLSFTQSPWFQSPAALVMVLKHLYQTFVECWTSHLYL